MEWKGTRKGINNNGLDRNDGCNTFSITFYFLWNFNPINWEISHDTGWVCSIYPEDHIQFNGGNTILLEMYRESAFLCWNARKYEIKFYAPGRVSWGIACYLSHHPAQLLVYETINGNSLIQLQCHNCRPRQRRKSLGREWNRWNEGVDEGNGNARLYCFLIEL